MKKFTYYVIIAAVTFVGTANSVDIELHGGNSSVIVEGKNTNTESSDRVGVKGVSRPAGYYGIGVEGRGGYMGVLGDAAMAGNGARYGVYGYAAWGTTNYGVYGHANCDQGQTCYGVYASGDMAYTGSIMDVSDERLKKDVKSLEGSLEKLKRLKPKQYKMNQTEAPRMGFSDNKEYGFLAQELEEVFPELVSNVVYTDPTNKSAEAKTYKGVAYVELIPILVQAIQELEGEMKKLRASEGR